MLLIPILAAFGLFVTVFLPVLPNVSVLRAPDDPPEFMFASAWYYLSKSADILFQQILVMALILTAAKAQFRIVTIGLYIAIAFGGMHLMLSLDGFIPLYVARFTIAATLFGLVLPFIYLRMRDGFVWAYGLHWSFYAIDATLTHLLLASPPWAQS